MNNAQDEHLTIHNTTAAYQLAELVLSMQLITGRGLVARKLAREALGINDFGRAPTLAAITTNGTTRLIPHDEPVFLIRAQDAVGGDVVRDWANRAEAIGASAEIVQSAREHAAKMDAWPHKKKPDLPKASTT